MPFQPLEHVTFTMEWPPNGLPPLMPPPGSFPLGVYQGYPFRQKKPYGTGTEAQSVEKELGDFNYRDSQAFKTIVEVFGTDVRLKEFKLVLKAARFYVKKRNHIDLPKPSRNTMRSFALMVKYVETHYSILAPFLPHIVLCDDSKNPISVTAAEPEGPHDKSSGSADESV
jgi:hypothetical protein